MHKTKLRVRVSHGKLTETVARDLYHAANNTESGPMTLRDEVEWNATESNVRVVSIITEAYPDEITKEEARRLRRCGCTRVELIAISVDDGTVWRAGATHTLQDTREAVRLLKMYGMTVELRIQCCDVDKVMQDPFLHPDQLCLIPTESVRSMSNWGVNQYTLPTTVRYRTSGNRIIKRKKTHETANTYPRSECYRSNSAIECFLSIDDMDMSNIQAYLRLHVPLNPQQPLMLHHMEFHVPELRAFGRYALIREIVSPDQTHISHTESPASTLLRIAETIATNYGCNIMAVAPPSGSKAFYESRGYKDTSNSCHSSWFHVKPLVPSNLKFKFKLLKLWNCVSILMRIAIFLYFIFQHP